MKVFENGRDTFTAANAHDHQREAAVDTLQFVESLDGDRVTGDREQAVSPLLPNGQRPVAIREPEAFSRDNSAYHELGRTRLVQGDVPLPRRTCG